MLVGAVVLEIPNDGAGVLVLGAADAVALPNVNPPAGALVAVGAAAVDFERSPNTLEDVTDVGALEDELNKPLPTDAVLPNPVKLTGVELVMDATDELVVDVSALLTVPNENNPDVGAEIFVSTVLVVAGAETPVLPDVILPKLYGGGGLDVSVELAVNVVAAAVGVKAPEVPDVRLPNVTLDPPTGVLMRGLAAVDVAAAKVNKLAELDGVCDVTPSVVFDSVVLGITIPVAAGTTGVEDLRKLSNADSGLLASDVVVEGVSDEFFSVDVDSLFVEGNFNVAVTVTSVSLVSVCAGLAVNVKLVTLLFSSLLLSVVSTILAAVVVTVEGIFNILCALDDVLETTELLEDVDAVVNSVGVDGRVLGFGLSSSVVWKSRFIIFFSLC